MRDSLEKQASLPQRYQFHSLEGILVSLIHKKNICSGNTIILDFWIRINKENALGQETE